jgi:signal transduction histidine kinase/CheY-like chemotaxis protein
MSQIKTLFIFIAIAFEAIVFLYLMHVRDKDIQRSMYSYQTYHVAQPLQAVTNAYREKSQSIFTLFVNKDDVLSLVYKANSTKDTEVRAQIRQILFDKLKDKYEVFKRVGIKQLHFHLDDTTSFLRFHKPSKFGDKLHDIRHSLVLANKEKRFVEGFEEGRIYNGYRFVFPLSYQQQHIGTVEISIGFKAIAKLLHKDFNLQPYMILKDSVVKEKVFTNERRNYDKSFISSKYFHEVNRYSNTSVVDLNENAISKEEFERILSKQHNQLDAQLNKNKLFQHYEKNNDFSYIMTFVPIKNIKEKHIGYIVLMDKDYEYQRIHDEYMYGLILISLLGLSVLAFIYYLEKINHKLAKSEKMAQEATRSKSEFLANMSHEIRTPLNAILGYLNLMKKTEHNTQVEKYLGVILSSSQTLLSVINDILDFSKIESGQFSCEMSTFRTKDIFEQLHQMFMPTANEKGIKLTLDFDNEVEPYIQSDSTRLKQVVSNLLSNALKFTPDKGTVEMRVSCTRGQLSLKVIDSGIGIAKDKQDSIFLKFEQADSSTTRKYGGTGLGLAISYFIIDNLGGELSVESEPDQGSTFFFTIPVKVSTAPDKTEIDKTSEDNKLLFEGKILLVEDNKTNQMLMKIILSEFGLEVDIANDGLEAIECFKNDKYALILMDENMPNMNGIEATKNIIRLQSDNSLYPTPIIALTADAVDGAQEKFLQAGMKDYLSKPLDEEKLILVLKKYL